MSRLRLKKAAHAEDETGGDLVTDVRIGDAVTSGLRGPEKGAVMLAGSSPPHNEDLEAMEPPTANATATPDSARNASPINSCTLEGSQKSEAPLQSARSRRQSVPVATFGDDQSSSDSECHESGEQLHMALYFFNLAESHEYMGMGGSSQLSAPIVPCLCCRSELGRDRFIRVRRERRVFRGCIRCLKCLVVLHD